jgi:hypothetical protein
MADRSESPGFRADRVARTRDEGMYASYYLYYVLLYYMYYMYYPELPALWWIDPRTGPAP